MQPAVIILAAGQSSRMGAVKALLPLPGTGRAGNAMRGLVELYRSVGVEEIVLVSGFHAAGVEAEAAALGVTAVRNPQPDQGMFSSVREGVAALTRRAFSGAFFVQPVDVPLVRPLTLMTLQDAATQDAADAAASQLVRGEAGPHSVLVPVFEGDEGHPPLVPAACASRILSADGRDGLRGALRGLPLRHVPVADAMILEDMDTPDDYARLRVMAHDRETLSPSEAEALLRLRDVPEKGLRHARAVGAVACCLAEALGHARESAGMAAVLDPRLALAGGLLHDICKGQARHEAAAGELLQQLRLPVMARLVRDHRDLTLPVGEPVTERELIYLADKYCYGGSFVPLERRFGQKLEAFAQNEQACAAILGRLDRARALEGRLAREIHTEPAVLAEKVLARNCGVARWHAA